MADQASDAAAWLGRVLRASLIGVSAYGSSVIGGARHQSDLDLLAVVDRPPSNAQREDLVAGLLPLSGWQAVDATSRPLDLTVVVRADVVPWRYPPVRALQFGEWLRADLAAGRIAPPCASPDLAILLTTARRHSVPLAGAPVAALVDPVPPADLRRAVVDCLPGLLGNVRGDERNVLLTLARMWLTVATGDIAPKDEAASWLLARLPDPLRGPLALARAAYLGERQDEWRTNRAEVDAFAAEAAARIRSMAQPI